MTARSIADIVAAHRQGADPAETIRATYAAIRAHDDPALFVTQRPEAEAIAAARALAGRDPATLPLLGVPFAVKDNIDVAGLPTTAACPAFAYSAGADAFVVARLVAAGAIPIGKTNLDQFATGLVGVRSPYGVPRNAVRPELVPGGSSSGSASAVAAGIVPFALGTDTAGSGRVPAALQGIVGLKPSLGLLSATGMVPACRTLDTISIFAGDVDDAHAVLAVAAGFDAADAYSRPIPVGPLGAAPAAPVIGVPRPVDRFHDGDAVAAAAFEAAIARAGALGFRVVEVDLAPFLAVARLLYEGPWVAERYVAVRALLERDPDAFHPVTRAIIEPAGRLPATLAFEAAYKLAELGRVCRAVLTPLDALMVPSIPTAYTVEAVLADPIALNSKLGTYTNFVNLLDLAALAVPTDRRADGIPAGVTLIAASGTDAKLGALGRALQISAGEPIGATARRPADTPLPARLAPGEMEIVVVGAHLSGMPLNPQLTDRGGRRLRTTTTTDAYRLHALAGGPPFRPGLIKGAAGSGAPIAVEVWALPEATVGSFLAGIPAPLGLGTVELADGTAPKGFIAEPRALDGAVDITDFGGWRAYMTEKARGTA